VKRFDKPLHAPGVPKHAKRLRATMNLPEKRLWDALRKTDLPFRRQAPIGRYIADFVCHQARLIIEVDGFWHENPEGQLRDAKRDTWLASQGYRVLRFRSQQAMDDPQGVVDAILRTLPPRWGKGRVGGAGIPVCGEAVEAHAPPLIFLSPPTRTPTPPSPIEGEGPYYPEAPCGR
jgi:very-short-patch-repair endonuclease